MIFNYNDFYNVNDLFDDTIVHSSEQLVILPYKFSEINGAELHYKDVLEYFDSLFDTLQSFVKKVMVKKKGTIVMVVNPQIFEGGMGHYSPIISYALESLSKSLSKELNPFHINVFSIVLAEEQCQEYKKKYYKTKLSDLVSLHYKGLKKESQKQAICRFIDNADLLNGQTVTIGCNIGLNK